MTFRQTDICSVFLSIGWIGHICFKVIKQSIWMMVVIEKIKINQTLNSYQPLRSLMLYADCRGGGLWLCMQHKLWFPLVLALSLSQQSAHIHDRLSLFPPKSSWSEPEAERWPSPVCRSKRGVISFPNVLKKKIH